MAKTLIYFVSDLHGSSVCFRKFVNAAKIYKPQVMVLGGDVAGKAIQSIVKRPNGRYTCNFIGVEYDLEDGAELTALEKLIADRGYYPLRAEPGELEAMEAANTLDDLFLRLMRERLTEWLEIADARLRPLNIPLFLMLGNDDPPQLKELLVNAPWGTHCEGDVVLIDDEHEMISWGYPNTTPWHTYREQTEDQLSKTLDILANKLSRPERAIFNVHAPPYDTQLDDAPKLNDKMEVQASLGTVIMSPVGSTAVRQSILDRQPLLGLHGHIHESNGIRRLGRSMVINPGSDYSTGALMGALVTVNRDKVTGHQLVRG